MTSENYNYALCDFILHKLSLFLILSSISLMTQTDNQLCFGSSYRYPMGHNSSVQCSGFLSVSNNPPQKNLGGLDNVCGSLYVGFEADGYV